ncbi:MAG: hypothetical protein CMC50_03395 [Flavobacteriaceae bacterium]|nr:hypothetical protein [Flavobacteriaceae bacterium]
MLFFGLVLLIIGGNLLLKSAVSLSLKFNIPKILIGMTVVSFATSAPELIVSIKSAFLGSSDLAVSNVLGSNIANIGLVLGIIILISPIQISKDIYKLDWPIMMFSAIMFYLFILDLKIERYEGLILFSFLVISIFILIKHQSNIQPEVDLEIGQIDSVFKSISMLVFGGILLYLGSDWFVLAAIDIANYFNVSQRIIGISVVSVGTSIPELATSLVALINKEKNISIGNLIGSNIFNVFAVLGITSMLIPLNVIDVDLIEFDIYVMLFFAMVILPLIFFPKKYILGRVEGIIIFGCYLFYIYTIVQ